MKTFQMFLLGYLCFILVGCTTDKPSDKIVKDFIATKFAKQVNRIDFGRSVHRTDVRYDNVQIVNQWPDENLKGVFYIKVSYVEELNAYPGGKASKYETTWKFTKEGDQWAPDKYEKETIFIENVPLKYN
jgi:hypothetical protein